MPGIKCFVLFKAWCTLVSWASCQKRKNERFPRTCVMNVPWCMPGWLTSGFLLNRRRGKRSRHSRNMRNQLFYVASKGLIGWDLAQSLIGFMIFLIQTEYETWPTYPLLTFTTCFVILDLNVVKSHRYICGVVRGKEERGITFFQRDTSMLPFWAEVRRVPYKLGE